MNLFKHPGLYGRFSEFRPVQNKNQRFERIPVQKQTLDEFKFFREKRKRD